MTTILFHEKRGCQTNARQKKSLTDAGHAVEARDILREPWTAEVLRAYFGDTPVVAWFNPAAPAIKAGRIDPRALGPDAALALLVAEPILIRRPLLEIDGHRAAGFDISWLEARLGSRPGATTEACSRAATAERED